MEMLKESIKKEQDEEKQEHMKGLLLKMVSADKQEQERKRKQALLRDRKKQESELVKQGKTPYFLKRCKCDRCCHWNDMLTILFQPRNESLI